MIEVIPPTRKSRTDYDDRPKSKLVKRIMAAGRMSYIEAANALGVTESCFSNKLVRNSFTFEEIVKLADACAFDVIFLNTLTSEWFVVNKLFVSEDLELMEREGL